MGKSPPAGSPDPPAPCTLWCGSCYQWGWSCSLADPAQLSCWVAPLGGAGGWHWPSRESTLHGVKRKQTECFPHKSTHRSSEETQGRTEGAGQVPIKEHRRVATGKWNRRLGSGHHTSESGESGCAQLSEKLGWRETVFKGNPLKAQLYLLECF